MSPSQNTFAQPDFSAISLGISIPFCLIFSQKFQTLLLLLHLSSPLFMNSSSHISFFFVFSSPRTSQKDCATTDDRVRALLIRGPITNLSRTQVHFLLRIEDTVCYLTLIGEHAWLVPSRLYYCDDASFTRSVSADFTQCPYGALLQRSCCREKNLYLLTVVTIILVAWGRRKLRGLL